MWHDSTGQNVRVKSGHGKKNLVQNRIINLAPWNKAPWLNYNYIYNIFQMALPPALSSLVIQLSFS
jgi:hypothetical protein